MKCMYVYICIYVYTHTHAHTHTQTHTCIYVYMYTYTYILYLLGHKTCGAGGGSPEYLPIQHKGLFFAVEESVERFIICEVCGGVCPVSKETQCRGKKDLSGRKRDLLNTGIPLIPAAEPRCANTWALNSPCASMHACFVCVCVCICFVCVRVHMFCVCVCVCVCVRVHMAYTHTPHTHTHTHTHTQDLFAGNLSPVC